MTWTEIIKLVVTLAAVAYVLWPKRVEEVARVETISRIKLTEDNNLMIRFHMLVIYSNGATKALKPSGWLNVPGWVTHGCDEEDHPKQWEYHNHPDPEK